MGRKARQKVRAPISPDEESIYKLIPPPPVKVCMYAMCVSVCMYMYVCICMYVYVCIYMYGCICMYVCVCMYVYVCICMYVFRLSNVLCINRNMNMTLRQPVQPFVAMRSLVCTYVACMYVCMYVCVLRLMFVCVYVIAANLSGDLSRKTKPVGPSWGPKALHNSSPKKYLRRSKVIKGAYIHHIHPIRTHTHKHTNTHMYVYVVH